MTKNDDFYGLKGSNIGGGFVGGSASAETVVRLVAANKPVPCDWRHAVIP